MAVRTISLFPVATATNVTGVANMLVDDKNGNTRHVPLSMLRTTVFAGATGFTGTDPLNVGGIDVTESSGAAGGYALRLHNRNNTQVWGIVVDKNAIDDKILSIDDVTNTLSGVVSVAPATGAVAVLHGLTAGGVIASTATGNAIAAFGATTAARWLELVTTGGDSIFGVESSAGGTLVSGSGANATVIRGSQGIWFSANAGSNHGHVDTSGNWTIPGNLTVSGTLAATGITIPGTSLTGTVLASSIVTSSLTTVGVLASPHMTSPTVDSGGLTVTTGGVTVLAGGADITGAATFHSGVTVSTTLAIGGTLTPGAALDVQSTTAGLIIPRMTATQRLALTPVPGMIVYDTTSASFQMYNGAWGPF